MIRLVISEPGSEAAARLFRNLSRHNRVQVIGQAYDGVEAVQMALTLQPDALLIEEHLAGLSGPEVCSLVGRHAPQIACLLLAERADPPALRAAMRSGARALLAADEEIGAAVAALQACVRAAQQADAPENRRLADPAQMPRTFVGLAAREGLGATTLLAALGLHLARAQTGEVVFLDWRPQLSDLAAMLGLRPRYCLVDLIPYGQALDLEAVSACLTRHDSGLWVLPGMLHPQHVWLQPLSVGFAAQLLGILRRRFQYLIVDLPPGFCPPELYIARHAHALLLISSLAEAGTLRATATLTDLLRAQRFPDDRLRLVLSRQDRRDPFRSEDLTSLAHLPLTATIPEDPNLPRLLQSSANAANLRSPGAIAVRDLAETLVKEALPQTTSQVLTAEQRLPGREHRPLTGAQPRA